VTGSGSRDRGVVGAGAVLLAVGTLALAVGVLEVTALWLRHRLTGQMISVGPRIIWMAPLGYLLLVAPLALVLAVLARLVPRRTAGLLAFGLAVVSGTAVVTLVGLATMQRLDLGAMLLLGVGVAVQVARVSVRRARSIARAAPWTFGVLTLVLALAAAGIEIRRAVRSRQPAAARHSGPNVLFLVLDTVRAIDLGLYGYDLATTPRLDALARRGIVFENAFATSSWTLPSHLSMFTGRFPHEFDADRLWPPATRFTTVADVLAQRGYRTGGFVANFFYTTGETGLAQGFQTWEDYPLSLDELFFSTELFQLYKGARNWLILRQHAPKSSATVSAQFLDWQAGTGGAPFFAFLNYFDAHSPYTAPDSLLRRFARRATTRPRDRYDAAIAHMDDEVGRLLETLERRGVLGNTVVIITSDHGEHFGSHGLFEHGNSLYSVLVRVPLLVLLPGGTGAGQRVSQPVSLRNLAATVLDLAGDSTRALPGRSLSRFWRGDDPAAEPQDEPILAELTEAPPGAPLRNRDARTEMRCLVWGGWHYILKADGSAEAYEYGPDPHELKNLVTGGVEQNPILAALGDSLRAIDTRFPRKRVRSD
jgi:arylsulfatase A-like enzyme